MGAIGMAQVYRNEEGYEEFGEWVGGHWQLLTAIVVLGFLAWLSAALWGVIGPLRRAGWNQWRVVLDVGSLVILAVLWLATAAVVVLLMIGPGTSEPFWSR